MSMKPLTWVAILSSACHQPDPATDSDSGGGLFDYSEKAYYSELVVTIDGVAESRGDGELYWRQVIPAPGVSCERSVELFFYPIDWLDTAASGHFFFPGGDDLARGATSTLSLAPYENHIISATLLSWAGVTERVHLSGGTVTYEQPGTAHHRLTVVGAAMCTPKGQALNTDPATDCQDTSMITFDFMGNLSRTGNEEGVAGWSPDGSSGDMCVKIP